MCSISSSPSSNRTFGFPEYGFPIIFFRRLSLSLGLLVYLPPEFSKYSELIALPQSPFLLSFRSMMKVLPLSSPKVMLSLEYKRYYGQIRLPCRPRKISFPYIYRLLSCRASTRVSRVHCRMAAPACHPCYPGSPSIGSGSYRQDRCYGLPHCRKGSTTPSHVSRLHLGSLTLRPAGLLDSLKEPLSGNLMLQVTLNTSLKLRGRTTKLPPSDFNRQVIRFTRHTLQMSNYGG